MSFAKYGMAAVRFAAVGAKSGSASLRFGFTPNSALARLGPNGSGVFARTPKMLILEAAAAADAQIQPSQAWPGRTQLAQTLPVPAQPCPKWAQP